MLAVKDQPLRSLSEDIAPDSNPENSNAAGQFCKWGLPICTPCRARVSLVNNPWGRRSDPFQKSGSIVNCRSRQHNIHVRAHDSPRVCSYPSILSRLIRAYIYIKFFSCINMRDTRKEIMRSINLTLCNEKNIYIQYTRLSGKRVLQAAQKFHFSVAVGMNSQQSPAQLRRSAEWYEKSRPTN